MSSQVLLPAATSLIALVFALLLVDQWRIRRHAFQAIWAAGMLSFGIASGAEAIAAANSWNELLYRAWYLTGAVWTAGWLGLGTAFLLGRTRFGYTFALTLFLAGLFTFLAVRRSPEAYPDAGALPVLYFVIAGILALAVAVETYFGNDRWPRIAALAVGGATVLSIALVATTTLAAPGYMLDPVTGTPVATPFPASLRLLTPFLNITGGLSLGLGAFFSAYVFMPKRRILAYSLDPSQTGDEFLFNLSIAPVAIVVNFAASLPGTARALVTGRINSRVPATILIAIGAFLAGSGDVLGRFGATGFTTVGRLLAVVFLFLGFLVSIEVFSEFRVPFTGIVLRRRHERPEPAPSSLAPAGR